MAERTVDQDAVFKEVFAAWVRSYGRLRYLADEEEQTARFFFDAGMARGEEKRGEPALTTFELVMMGEAHEAGIHERPAEYPNCPECHPGGLGDQEAPG